MLCVYISSSLIANKVFPKPDLEIFLNTNQTNKTKKSESVKNEILLSKLIPKKWIEYPEYQADLL